MNRVREIKSKWLHYLDASPRLGSSPCKKNKQKKNQQHTQCVIYWVRNELKTNTCFGQTQSYDNWKRERKKEREKKKKKKSFWVKSKIFNSLNFLNTSGCPDYCYYCFYPPPPSFINQVRLQHAWGFRLIQTTVNSSLVRVGELALSLVCQVRATELSRSLVRKVTAMKLPASCLSGRS